MHFMQFALKRAHLRAQAIVRPWCAPHGITPARFDILTLLDSHRAHPPRQHQIRRALGLSAPTISRALKRLQELGFITRARCPNDARARIVSLTRDGLRRFRRFVYRVLWPGHLDLAYECAFGSDPYLAGEVLDDTYLGAITIGAFFGDTSTLRYPTGHPDD